MDIVYAAMRVGIAEVYQFEALSWAIFAFFHFLPATQSPTHTFHEVMRGVKKLQPGIRYQEGQAHLPIIDTATEREQVIQ